MSVFIMIARDRGFATFASTVCATGGGAIKFSDHAKEQLGVDFFKVDELMSVIAGIEFICEVSRVECYFYDNPHTLNTSSESTTSPDMSTTDTGLMYPFLVVNIGSGVSIMAVRAKDKFERISGTR